jgi:hypothetical protein
MSSERNNIVSSNSFTLRFTNPTGTADSVYLFQSGAEPKGTTIITTQVNGISYEQILQSQNGAVYQVNGLTINIVSAPSDGAKASQLLKPFIFVKKDVNGDEIRIEKFQTIDPYQRQFSYSFVDLVDDGEIFVLDGNTQFQYSIEANTAVNVTFNYVEVQNFDFGTQESEDKLKKEIDADNQLQDEAEYADELIIDADTIRKDNAVKTQKKNNWLIWILGATAVYLFINPFFKTNQKK